MQRYVRATGETETLVRLIPTFAEIVQQARRRHALRHRRRSARRPAAAGRGGLSAHLDGREGGRLGRDAAARKGSRDQRAVVQRTAAARRWIEEHGGDREGVDLKAAAGNGRARRSTSASGTRRSWTPVRRRRGRAGRRPCLPSQSGIRDFTGPSGSRRGALGVGDAGRRRPPADASRPSLAGARAIPTTSRNTTATSARAMRPITRARSGRG